MERENYALILMLANEYFEGENQFLLLLFAIFQNLIEEMAAERNGPAIYCILNREQQIIKSLLSDNWLMKKHIRLTEAAFNNVLQMITTQKHHGWQLKLKLVVFLFWLACGTSYRVISVTFHIPKTTVHDFIHEVMTKVLSLREIVIKLPKHEEVVSIGEGFAQMAGNHAFRVIAGAIDGCHVEIKVKGPNEADYFSRRLKYSVQFQAVCDNKGQFLNVFAGYPGSVHDARVLRESPLMAGLYPPPGYALLGDSGYPCISAPITIITPYREPVQGRLQQLFNSVHKRGRNVIERAFGMLKARWRRIFMQRLVIKHTKAANVIGACCIMHNICMMNGDIVNEEENEIEGEEDEREPARQAQEEGFHLRDHLALMVSRELI